MVFVVGGMFAAGFLS